LITSNQTLSAAGFTPTKLSASRAIALCVGSLANEKTFGAAAGGGIISAVCVLVLGDTGGLISG
jgi:hypothetical protein